MLYLTYFVEYLLPLIPALQCAGVFLPHSFPHSYMQGAWSSLNSAIQIDINYSLKHFLNAKMVCECIKTSLYMLLPMCVCHKIYIICYHADLASITV